ncbi:neutrophil cytosol factor 2 isoform X1 [Electrophorus electricus]|uniref:neutrophil cytosol factor 2 isoform X1 n=1 Tax=Electrophorus electricus TaxID=8005 RepID=UPI0015D08785|nr:neutrophil cytosol factor 2 isoform X1 [Electrophorus electricus]
MSFVSCLRQWADAVAFSEKGDKISALQAFLEIQDKTSKISFNIGCLHLNNDDFDVAEKAFDNSIGKDEHLAVAFFQRGITFYKKEKFEESLLDFQQAFKELRGNQLIDYKPLGLRYKLYACEVLHNIGLVYATLGKWEKAQENLLTALNLRSEAKFGHIDQAVESILKQKLFSLVGIPAGLLFKPNKHYVAELEKKDYLGKAKVLSSVVPADNFSGFAPLQPQVVDAPTAPKQPEVLRALEGEPHTVLYEFIPETEEELAVLPGNIVFVLQRGDDNWASVMFNGRKGLVPYNYLEPLASKTLQVSPSNSNAEIPAPPQRPAPNKPTKDPKVFSGCIVKVHFMFTIAMCISPGQPFTAVLQLVSTKLKRPASTLRLSYAKPGSSDKVTVDESEMEVLWSCMKENRLTLWCSATQDKALAQENMVALFSYEASTPEDLEFREGDVITVLSKVNDEWLEGECKGKVGIFPSSFVADPNKDQ